MTTHNRRVRPLLRRTQPRRDVPPSSAAVHPAAPSSSATRLAQNSAEIAGDAVRLAYEVADPVIREGQRLATRFREGYGASDASPGALSRDASRLLSALGHIGLELAEIAYRSPPIFNALALSRAGRTSGSVAPDALADSVFTLLQGLGLDVSPGASSAPRSAQPAPRSNRVPDWIHVSIKSTTFVEVRCHFNDFLEPAPVRVVWAGRPDQPPVEALKPDAHGQLHIRADLENLAPPLVCLMLLLGNESIEPSGIYEFTLLATPPG